MSNKTNFIFFQPQGGVENSAYPELKASKPSEDVNMKI
jgi:hypothetical protein